MRGHITYNYNNDNGNDKVSDYVVLEVHDDNDIKDDDHDNDDDNVGADAVPEVPGGNGEAEDIGGGEKEGKPREGQANQVSHAHSLS